MEALFALFAFVVGIGFLAAPVLGIIALVKIRRLRQQSIKAESRLNDAEARLGAVSRRLETLGQQVREREAAPASIPVAPEPVETVQAIPLAESPPQPTAPPVTAEPPPARPPTPTPSTDTIPLQPGHRPSAPAVEDRRRNAGGPSATTDCAGNRAPGPPVEPGCSDRLGALDRDSRCGGAGRRGARPGRPVVLQVLHRARVDHSCHARRLRHPDRARLPRGYRTAAAPRLPLRGRGAGRRRGGDPLRRVLGRARALRADRHVRRLRADGAGHAGLLPAGGAALVLDRRGARSHRRLRDAAVAVQRPRPADRAVRLRPAPGSRPAVGRTQAALALAGTAQPAGHGAAAGAVDRHAHGTGAGLPGPGHPGRVQRALRFLGPVRR